MTDQLLETVTVNDIHSALCATEMARVERVTTVADVQAALELARRTGLSVAIAGGHHAMGGQQFVTGGLLLDMRSLARVLDFDRDAGLLTVEAGIEWPELVAYLLAEQD
ncbi:MAG: L-gulono,4-lactone dehydrogenase, partial [Thermoleophilia bacterium]|nr:L-gulono,4-lactone dehydrogenase [Thermoleophilia bacterium]